MQYPPANDNSRIENRQSRMQIQSLEQLSDEEFWDYAQSLATEEAVPPATHEEYLECDTGCNTGQGRCCIALQALCEVVPPPHKLTLLPLCPPWMLGITAWRGHIIPVVDLSAYYIFRKTNEIDTTDVPQFTYPRSDSMLLILEEGNTLLAIQVAFVGSIISLERTQLTSPEQAPSWYPRHLLSMLLGVHDGLVVPNSQALIEDMMEHIKVTAAYE